MKTMVTLTDSDINEILVKHIAEARKLKPKDLDIRWMNDRTAAIIETKEVPAVDPELRVNWSDIAASVQEDDEDENPR